MKTKSQRDSGALNKCVGNSAEILEDAHEREIRESKNYEANNQICNTVHATLP